MLKHKISEKQIFALFLVVLGILAVIYLYPLIGFGDSWLPHDYDHNWARLQASVNSVKDHHQLPLWTPWQCGGNTLLANPQSSIGLDFIFSMFFGVILGSRIAQVILYIIGIVGCILLGKQLKFTNLGIGFLTVLFVFSTWTFYYLLLGHIMRASIMFLPLILFFILKSQKNKKFIFPAALLTSLTFYSGDVYVFIGTVIFVSLFLIGKFIEKKKINYIKIMLIFLILTLCFSSFKLIPALEHASSYPRLTEAETRPVDSFLLKSFYITGIPLESYSGEISYKSKSYPIHDMGSFIGIVPLIIFGSSIILFRKKYSLLLPSAFFLILSFTFFDTPIKFIWTLLQTFPIFNSLRTQARFFIFFIFGLSILSGFFITKLQEESRRKIFIGVILSILLLGTFVSYQSLTKESASHIPELKELGVSPSLKFEQFDFAKRTGLNSTQFQAIRDRALGTFMFSNILSNKGQIDCYEPSNIGSYAKSKGTPNYRGEYWSEEGEVSLISWTPNKIILKSNLNKSGIVVVNQNYYEKWKSNFEIFNNSGIIGLNVPEGEKTIELEYSKRSAIIGLLITLITLIMGLYYLSRKN